MLLAPVCKNICNALGAFIGWATDLRPFWMGMIISVVVGIVLTLPISSAAICAAVGISGGAVLAGLTDGSVTVEIWNGLALAGGAATAGCCAHMLGFAILSFPDNGFGGFVALGLGPSMVTGPKLMIKPVQWLPPVITSAITGPIATCVFHMRNNGPAISSGMGTSGLVGQIMTYQTMVATESPVLVILKIVVFHFLLPGLLSYVIYRGMRNMGYIKDGQMKLNV